MIWSVPVLQDTTIYESDPFRNTGLDNIIEVSKIGEFDDDTLKESRILMKFDLSDLPNVLSANGISINDISASIRLYKSTEGELPRNYTLESKMVYSPWDNGTGYYYFPVGTISNTALSDGATWSNTKGSGSLLWAQNLSGSAVTSYNNVAGGGNWFSSSIITSSFSPGLARQDLDLNVTAFVKSWHIGTNVNNGLLISLKQSEITGSNSANTYIRFHASETETVYEPHLYISWASSSYNTGSLTLINVYDDPVIYTKYFKNEYPIDSKIRFYLGTRSRFPKPNFSQNSEFQLEKALPYNSFYQIIDAHNNQVLIPYSSYTRLNTNSSGSYFDLYTTMMYPERFYRFEIKTEVDNGYVYFNRPEFTFKAVA
jgi:hypothetical protein